MLSIYYGDLVDAQNKSCVILYIAKKKYLRNTLKYFSFLLHIFSIRINPSHKGYEINCNP